MNPESLRRLKSLLREIPIIRDDSAKLDVSFGDICNIVFDDDVHATLWDEEVLNGLLNLFQIRPPSPKIFGKQLKDLEERTAFVRKADDLFFSLLYGKSTSTDVFHALRVLTKLSNLDALSQSASSHIDEIRRSNSTPTEKLEAFVDHLTGDLGLDLSSIENDLRQIIASIKAQEVSGKVNALLLTIPSGAGVVIPLSISLSAGQGKASCVVPGRDDFKTTIDRARRAMINWSFLSGSQDVDCSLDITSVDYRGDSIALAAAVAMYSATTGECFDPFTAFTGNINLDGTHYKISSVSGVEAKLKAALASGCRRVFLPADNRSDVPADLHEKLHVEYVNNLVDVLLNVQVVPSPISGTTPQIRKLNFLRAYCQGKGWDLSDEKQIQDALQFTVSPPHPPEITINLYYTGAHTPKKDEKGVFQELIDGLAAFDELTIPVRTVNKTFLIKDEVLRKQLKEALEQLRPEIRQEQYCDFSFRFAKREENLAVTQYTKGSLQLQGKAGDLYKQVLDIIIPLYNIRYPNAQLSISDYLEAQTDLIPAKADSRVLPRRDVPFPHIGTDESGKGDYFGPLVVAGVWLDVATSKRIESLGVKDSKLLSDKRCKELATRIRELCAGKFEEVEISPERYNELYEQFTKEGKNLNHLLAWGHARAIESLLPKLPCDYAIADQFGDEKYILSKLMEKGKRLELIQTPKGERYLAVAAASILARDRFLSRVEKLSAKYGLPLPKGASEAVLAPARSIVTRMGIGELKNVAKLHHKTTQRVTTISQQ